MNNEIRAITIDADGNTWVGTLGGAVAMIRSENSQITAVAEMPSAIELYSNYPNPFNPSTTISFTVPETGVVSLTIHDTLGRTVRTLVDGLVPAGAHEVVWDGRDEAGNVAANGVYFSRLQVGEAVRTGKMLLMK
jgi:flagellar hook assembly protein FlgD